METSDPSGRLAVEDLSDCRSESSHSESQLRAFQDYERMKELNLSVDKSKDDCQIEPKDFHLGLESGRASIRFDEFENTGRNHPLTLNKGKDFGYVAGGLNEMAYTLDRTGENDESLEAGNLCRTKNPTAKDLLFNLRENRHKSTHASLTSLSDRYGGKDLNFAVSEKDIKDFGLLKNYSIDRMKEFNLSLDRMRDSHFALERLRGGGGLLENPPMMEHGELKNMQMQSRSQDLEAIALERMRRSHLLGADLSAQNLSTQIPHPHSITQMQHSQQQQQQQAKSFTIDAILGLRNNPREKRNQQQQYRKHQGQEGGAKNGGSSSCSGGGGKLKRVRTIFTAEQLERLEGEFARQQYMVGPERLYLAHALRLTEAQVKVWFQNRRIKWRKHHHEQQSQRVHEFQRTLNSSLEHEDSNEADKWSKYIQHMYFDTRDPPDMCWRHPQRRSQSFPLSRSRSPESPTNYYSSSSYKPQKGHMCSGPMYSKYTSHHGSDAMYMQARSKSHRDVHHPSNLSPKRKIHYDDELGDIEKLKLIDEELGNIVEGNVDENVEEEITAEEDQEFLDKDYEEHEADDEVEEESDPTPHAHRPQRANKTELLKQRWRSEQQPDPRRIRGQQRVTLVDNPSPRYYHNVAEHDISEPLSEEDFVRTSMKTSKRQPSDYYWVPRTDPDRYENVTPLMRRARTKPDMDRLIDPEMSKARRCNRCGNLSSKKNEPPMKSTCRFDDSANIPIKGSIGDEPENHEQLYGRCKYATKEANAMDIPTLYAMKSRRSRDSKSPIYDIPEHGQDKLSPEYCRSSRYPRKSDAFMEKSKRSLHTSHGTARIPPRYVE